MGNCKRRQRFERSISPPIGIHSLIFIPARTDPGAPRSSTRPGEKVRPLIGGDPKNPSFPRIAGHLGPLPSERGADDPTPSRDRLAAELSVSTGLRVDEVAKLTLDR